MSYLVDTDIVIGWLKGRQREVALLRELSQGELAISLITYGEGLPRASAYGRITRW